MHRDVSCVRASLRGYAYVSSLQCFPLKRGEEGEDGPAPIETEVSTGSARVLTGSQTFVSRMYDHFVPTHARRERRGQRERDARTLANALRPQ